VKRLADYVAEADALWPARLDKVAAMEAWLSKARVLEGHLGGHRAYLAELRRRAPQREGESAYRFAGAEEQWEHDTLAGLVAGIEDFAAKMIPDVERRIEVARTVRARTIEAPAPAEAWQRALASIADPAACPRYQGLRLAPQLGLVPLGRDAGSGLWEFAHLESGEPPARDASGKLSIAEATGIVLVLLPGGAFSMGTRRPDAQHKLGSPNVDPESHGSEAPVSTVTLAPFFFAKYEITQGQWLRATGSNPSAYTPGRVVGGRTHTLVHPVEQIGWKEADQMLWRIGLRLPTEAQWEYAARGGTTTVFATGDRRESLQGFANLADRYCHDHDGPGSWPFELWLDDGYVVHAPVGSYRPNGFGLHDTAGNVWEFVQDRYGGYDLPVSPGDGERQAAADAPRVFRGGGFRSNAVHARSGDRYGLYARDFRGFDIGARAARGVDP
jgi:formylglycine-generating enzyme required for sulfatase activity